MNSVVSSEDRVSIKAPIGLPESRNPNIMRALRGTAQAEVEAQGEGKIISIQVNTHRVIAHQSVKRLGPEDKDVVLEQGQEALNTVEHGRKIEELRGGDRREGTRERGQKCLSSSYGQFVLGHGSRGRNSI